MSPSGRSPGWSVTAAAVRASGNTPASTASGSIARRTPPRRRPTEIQISVGQPHEAVRGDQDDYHEAETDQGVEALVEGEPEYVDAAREDADENEEDGAHEGADRVAQAAEHGDDEDVDGAGEVHDAGRDVAPVPGAQDSGDPGDKATDGEEGDPVESHAVAEGLHPARVVADPLEGEPQLGSDEVAQAEVHRHGGADAHVVEGRRVLARLARGTQDLGESDVAAEDLIVLEDDVEEANGQGQGQHQEVDPVGTGGDRPEDSPQERRERERHEGGGDRRQRESDLGACCGRGRRQRGDGEHVGGEPGQRRLGKRDHPAVAGHEDQAEGGDAQDDRVRRDGEDPEAGRHQRIDGEDGKARQARHALAAAQPPRRGSPERAHAGRPKRPCGRTARTPAMITKVRKIE